jgi:electron transfer flavoprotein beta subunit
MLNIIVCIKQVLDPEAPASTYKVDEVSQHMTQRGVPPVMSPFDENALEAALIIKSIQPAKIIVLSAGWNLSKAVLRKALAAGADDLILLEDSSFENMNSIAAATVLSAAIRKIGIFDLILTGRLAADLNAGMVGYGIAEILGIPCIGVARNIEVKEGRVRVESVTPDGFDVIESALPVLVTASNELGGLRMVALKEIMAAQKKPIVTWNSSQIGVDITDLSRTKILSLFIPQRKILCEIIKGETPEQSGAHLALKLKEKKLI